MLLRVFSSLWPVSSKAYVCDWCDARANSAEALVWGRIDEPNRLRIPSICCCFILEEEPTTFAAKVFPYAHVYSVFLFWGSDFSLDPSACDAMLASDVRSCYAVDFEACSSSDVPEKFKFEFTPKAVIKDAYYFASLFELLINWSWPTQFALSLLFDCFKSLNAEPDKFAFCLETVANEARLSWIILVGTFLAVPCTQLESLLRSYCICK